MPKIAVFAGHGGRDNGAQANGLREKDFTLAVSNATTRILRQRGYEVINNRTTDVDRSIAADARRANAENVDAVVEIHLNSNEGPPQTGTEVYYSVRDQGTGRLLAQNILDQIVALGFVDRGIKTRTNALGQDFFGIIRLTNAPAVLVETAFINNPNDMAMFDVEEMGLAIANGITETFPITGPPVPPPTGGDPVVRNMQIFLNNNYGAGLTVDGIFGPRTKTALVKGLQTELNRQFGRNLTVDGIFGPATKAATVPVRRGARGNITYIIQSGLYGRGYRAIPDGVFGAQTENAVRAFQNDFGLFVDGIAGPDTQARLFA